jgi:glycosyltransferase involved in cell wall biosynthesis
MCRLLLLRILDELTVSVQTGAVSALFDELTVGRQDFSIPLLLRYVGTPEVLAVAEQVMVLRRAVTPASVGAACTTSIVIPHFNHCSFLPDALLSLSRQTVSPDEIIVVDDESRDRDVVRDIVRAFQSSLPVRLIENSKRMYAGPTRQVGAEAATGDIIVMHDADDISHPQRLSVTKEFFARHRYACQLNVGFWRLTEPGENPESTFSRVDIGPNLLGTSEIDKDMRRVFSSQRFAVKRPYGIRRGGYGYGTLPPRSVSAGHVAYPRYLVPHLRWSSPEQLTFTPYEDYEFNTLLYLSMRSSYELTLPLLGYRRGTTTNIVFR